MKKNIIVNVVNEDLKKNPIILKAVTENKPTVIVAHSSGTSEALAQCKFLDNVERMVLLDPVDSRILTDRENMKNPYDFNYQSLNEIFMINAEKSYKWRFFPPRIPFIPLFSLTMDKINVPNKTPMEFAIKSPQSKYLPNGSKCCKISKNNPKNIAKHIILYFMLL